jgi:spore coat protein A
VSGVPIEPQFPNPTQLHEFWGNVVLVNGRVWPYKRVQRAPYRIRLLNAADTRTFVLQFSNGMTFYKIGTDAGLLPDPLPVTAVVLAPAQRLDLVFDFSGTDPEHPVDLLNVGGDVLFKGYVPAADLGAPAVLEPRPGFVLSDGKGGRAERTGARTTGQVLRFLPHGAASLPFAGGPLGLPLQVPGFEVAERDVALFKGEDVFGRNTLLLGNLQDGSLLWNDFPEEIVRLNTWERWNIYNATVSGHPIHVHLVDFVVESRQACDFTVVPKRHEAHMGHGVGITGGRITEVRLGVPVPLGEGDAGALDTVVALPHQVTRIVMFFDRPGFYVFHCHLLSHEDWAMMRKVTVVD